jgi:hypothetical protein
MFEELFLFWLFEFWSFEFVSDFRFRASDFLNESFSDQLKSKRFSAPVFRGFDPFQTKIDHHGAAVVGDMVAGQQERPRP